MLEGLTEHQGLRVEPPTLVERSDRFLATAEAVAAGRCVDLVDAEYVSAAYLTTAARFQL